MTRLRMRVADRLKGAQNTYAMLTTFNEVDMTALMEMRTQYKVLFCSWRFIDANAPIQDSTLLSCCALWAR